MKKIKYLMLFLLVSLVSGCMSVSMDIDIKNNDSGTLVYTVAYEESYQDSAEFTVDDIENVVVEDITFQKGDSTYIGKKATVTFSSLEELNNTIAKLNEDEESEEMDSLNFTATREGNKVLITVPSDEESYEQMQMFLGSIDYKFNIAVEGKIISHNADNYDKDNGTLTWNVGTVLQKGINLEYQTGHNYLIFAAIGVIFLAVVILMVKYISTFTKKKQY